MRFVKGKWEAGRVRKGSYISIVLEEEEEDFCHCEGRRMGAKTLP